MADQWFAARIGSAPVAIAALTAQDFVSFYPTRTARRVHRNRVISYPKPLFPLYLFVALDLEAWGEKRPSSCAFVGLTPSATDTRGR
jgi:Transcription termination factor nusG